MPRFPTRALHSCLAWIERLAIPARLARPAHLAHLACRTIPARLAHLTRLAISARLAHFAAPACIACLACLAAPARLTRLACLAAPACLACLAAPAAADPGPDGAGYYRALEAATRLYDARDMEGAAPGLERLTEAFPEDGRTWLLLATARYHLRQYPAAIEAYHRAFALGAGQPWNTSYNLACCYALAGDKDNAFRWLERSLAARWEDRPFLVADADFASLHDDPRWPAVAGLVPPGRELIRDAGWRYDLDFLTAETRRLHADPFRLTPEDAFLDRVSALSARVPSLTDTQIRVELQKLVALLGDGHSHVRLFGAGDHPRVAHAGTEGPGVLPIQAYVFDDGLFVVRAWNGHEDLVGAEILGLGSLDTPELQDRVRDLIPHDNPMQFLWMGPRYLVSPPVLENLGALAAGHGEDGGAVPVRIRDREGRERTVDLVPDPGGRTEAGLPPVQIPGAPSARYLAEKHRLYWFEELPAADAVYVQFNSVRDAGDESLADFAARLRTWIDAHPVTRLILDVRNNGGGNSFLYPPLLKTLIYFELSGEDRDIYALIGRNTFSAAQNFATDVDTWTGAVFAGEPSGSRPSFIGESTTTVLPWSGTVVGLSSRYHQTSVPGDERLWIAPRIPVALTSADYFAGRDPVLDAVLAVIAGEPEPN